MHLATDASASRASHLASRSMSVVMSEMQSHTRSVIQDFPWSCTDVRGSPVPRRQTIAVPIQNSSEERKKNSPIEPHISMVSLDGEQAKTRKPGSDEKLRRVAGCRPPARWVR